jgi:hypothetical protein
VVAGVSVVYVAGLSVAAVGAEEVEIYSVESGLAGAYSFD